MTTHRLQDFIRHLCRTRSVAEDGHLTDAQLLERFATARDEAAFEVLVWRHGSLVLNIARRLVRHHADAEDIFQATFLTLARKATSIRRGTSVGSWLYKVAYRIALRLRQVKARREQREQAGVEMLAATESVERDEKGTAALIAEEVSRLPERYRAAVVLCYLQGSTTEEAARILGCPRGTILSRLAWARHRLSRRLIRRGVAPAVALTTALFGEGASAMPSVALVTSVIRAALPFAAGKGAVPAVSPQVAALAQGALQTMMWNKIKIAVAVMCVFGLTGAGAGWLTHGRERIVAVPAVAEKQPEQDLPRAAEPDRQQELRKEIGLIKAKLEELTVVEEKQAEQLSDQIIEARLRLVEAQEELRIREREGQFVDEEDQVRLKEAMLRLRDLEKMRSVIDTKSDSGKKFLENQMKEAEHQKQAIRSTLDKIRERNMACAESLRLIRKAVYKLEENLRRMESRQARQREEFAEKRQALRTHLQQLGESAFRVEPADRLGAVERKIDALRREVNELRRAVERLDSEPRKKP